MKALVVYYSYTGKTELVAKAIAGETGADLRKVEEANQKTGAAVYLFGGMAASQDKFAEIKPVDFSLDGYDTVFVGTPVWASKSAPAINTFISQADFKGKDVIAFSTMGGKNGALKNLTDKIEKKSGKIIGSFAIRTSRASDNDLARRAKEALKQIPVAVA
jgi:flavodoxin